MHCKFPALWGRANKVNFNPMCFLYRYVNIASEILFYFPVCYYSGEIRWISGRFQLLGVGFQEPAWRRMKFLVQRSMWAVGKALTLAQGYCLGLSSSGRWKLETKSSNNAIRLLKGVVCHDFGWMRSKWKQNKFPSCFAHAIIYQGPHDKGCKLLEGKVSSNRMQA